ncbi:MAG TPA: sensor domain-containing diguanylate cyclase [Solimonas sp.]|nr:sensor domain-containing diguanylate cyclase [Solimonas sp.]
MSATAPEAVQDALLRPGRERVLRRVLFMLTGLSVSAAIATFILPRRLTFEWLVFVVAAALTGVGYPLVVHAQRRRDRVLEGRVAIVMIVIGTVIYLQRVAFAYHGPLLDRPDMYVLRPVLVFFPFIAVAILALLHARQALRLVWAGWAIVALIAITGLMRHPDMTVERDGMVATLLWLLVGCPLFILVMNTLPYFEEAVLRSSEELERMRGRAELLEKLEESERRFDLVIDSLEVGAWDRKDGVAWWSPRLYELIGYVPDEIAPGWENMIDLLHPEDRERALQAVKEGFRSGVLDVEFRVLTRHKGYRWFHSRGRGHTGPDGSYTRFVGALADIDDRHRAQTELSTARDELTRLAYRDSLTGLYNRRHFDEQLASECERAQRNTQPLSLLLLDLDHFKAYNDHYGHAAGDQALVEVARRIVSCLRRPADLAVRLGGEEFAVLLPETTAEGAREVGERILVAVRAPPIPHPAAPAGHVTISIGFAVGASFFADQGRAAPELFDAADRALYAVKNRGRDGIEDAALIPAA